MLKFVSALHECVLTNDLSVHNESEKAARHQTIFITASLIVYSIVIHFIIPLYSINATNTCKRGELEGWLGNPCPIRENFCLKNAISEQNYNKCPTTFTSNCRALNTIKDRMKLIDMRVDVHITLHHLPDLLAHPMSGSSFLMPLTSLKNTIHFKKKKKKGRLHMACNLKA